MPDTRLLNLIAPARKAAFAALGVALASLCGCTPLAGSTGQSGDSVLVRYPSSSAASVSSTALSANDIPEQGSVSSRESSAAPSPSESASSPASSGAAQAGVDVRSLPAGSVLSSQQVQAAGEDACFTVEPIDDETFQRMYGLSFKEDCTVPREDLRYIRVLHATAEGETHVGELVMNKAVAQDVCDIFRKLYDARYPIEKMHLIDDYDASDDASMEDDNTSSFNYRLIAGTNQMSNHAYGLAIDINPYYNPYCIPSEDYVSPTSAYRYGDRTGSWPYKINEGDLCHRLFLEAGFTWGGYWDYAKDYQHFEKAI